MQKVKLPLDVLNLVLKYLGNRPYIEVYEIVKKLTESLETIKDTDKE